MKITLPSGFALDSSRFVLQQCLGGTLEAVFSLGLTLPQSWERMYRLRKSYLTISADQKENTVRFPALPFQNTLRPGLIARIEEWGQRMANSFRNLLVLGIGGSSLGGRMVHQALTHPYSHLKKNGSALNIFFTGDNLDPFDTKALMEVLDPSETALLVISKSGTTVEPLSALLVLVEWLGKDYPRHLTFVTDPFSGALRKLAQEKSIEVFPLDPGVGGRWSVLTPVGLLVAAAAGVEWQELLRGARSMDGAMDERSPAKNPAFLYAALSHLSHKHGMNEAVMMPYSKRLWFVAFWYVQLLAESLGKALDRRGLEVHTGRTPIPALGTTDMHAQTQQHQEGPRNKVITFIEVEDHGAELTLPSVDSFPPEMTENFAGKSMSHILKAALDANGRALLDDHRPSITLTLPKLNAFHLGELIYFLEMTVAWEGEFLNVDAYNQPGVEAYKKYLKQWLKT